MMNFLLHCQSFSILYPPLTLNSDPNRGQLLSINECLSRDFNGLHLAFVTFATNTYAKSLNVSLHLPL